MVGREGEKKEREREREKEREDEKERRGVKRENITSVGATGATPMFLQRQSSMALWPN